MKKIMKMSLCMLVLGTTGIGLSYDWDALKEDWATVQEKAKGDWAILQEKAKEGWQTVSEKLKIEQTEAPKVSIDVQRDIDEIKAFINDKIAHLSEADQEAIKLQIISEWKTGLMDKARQWWQSTGKPKWEKMTGGTAQEDQKSE